MVKENLQTKKNILSVAQELMLAKGFGATSIDEICSKARLTKGAFFHYFKSKDELGKVLLECFCDSTKEAMNCCIKLPDSDPLKRVFQYIDALIHLVRKTDFMNGCLLGCFAQELSDTHPEIRQLCASGFDGWSRVLERDLKDAKKKYTPKSKVDPKSLAHHFIAVLEGAQILAKTNGNKKVLVESLNHYRNYLEILYQPTNRRKL